MKHIFAALVALCLIGGAAYTLLNRDWTVFTNVVARSNLPVDASGGGGVSWVDYDKDGWQDILVRTKEGMQLHLFHNDKGVFRDVTERSGLLLPRSVNTGIFGDYDNDGCPDVVFTSDAPGQNGLSDILFHNNCDGTFTNVSEKAGVTAQHHGKGAAWGDYDNDGDLDLYVVTYGDIAFDKKERSWKMTGFTYEPNVLYRNNGDGTFTDVTMTAHVDGLPHCSRYSLDTPASDYFSDISATSSKPLSGQKANWQAVWFDYDNDGRVDLYVSNEISINTLYHNDGGSFSDVTARAGLCKEHSTHGVAIGDYDGNGFEDIYATGSRYNLLWLNNTDGTFRDATRESGAGNRDHLGWGVGAIDYDNDGNLDLYVINGTTHNESSKNDYPDLSDKLYRGNGHGRFVDVSATEGIGGNFSKSSGAFADFNNDGFSDVFAIADEGFERAGSNMLYRNRANGNHYLSVTLVGTKSNRDGIGARISAVAGDSTQIRDVIAGTSFLSQNSLVQTFGLGSATTVDALIIRWPSGSLQRLDDVRADQSIVVTER